jgi:NADPH-dependent curcumin reductase CurA
MPTPDISTRRAAPKQPQDVGAALARECPRGVDVMYEGVGGGLRAALLPHLAPGGRLLQVCGAGRVGAGAAGAGAGRPRQAP